ncbi:MAG: hypothetical protein OQK02_10705, partial [Marinobacter sp.]|nr:hypothetical protein [Marinobacter sp.]
EAGAFWGEIISHSASLFGAVADKVARDPARANYDPSKPKNGDTSDRKVTIIGGDWKQTRTLIQRVAKKPTLPRMLNHGTRTGPL